jgi:hypothetical protein
MSFSWQQWLHEKSTKILCICTLLVLLRALKSVERDLAVLLFNILLRILFAKVSFPYFSHLTLNFKFSAVETPLKIVNCDCFGTKLMYVTQRHTWCTYTYACWHKLISLKEHKYSRIKADTYHIYRSLWISLKLITIRSALKAAPGCCFSNRHALILSAVHIESDENSCTVSACRVTTAIRSEKVRRGE